MAELAARYDVHPNLLPPGRRRLETVLAGFSGNHERQEAFGRLELRAKIGELSSSGMKAFGR